MARKGNQAVEERADEDADLDFDSGEPIGDSVGPDEPHTVLVNGYDANGEATAEHVPVPSDQPPMPGFEKPELWDRFEGRKVNKVILTFAGTCDLSQDPALCKQLHLRNEVSFSISGEVTGKAFKLRTDKNGVTTVDGVATLNVTEVVSSDERDLEAVREAAQAQADLEWRGVLLNLRDKIENGDADEAMQDLDAILAGEDPGDLPDDDEPTALEASLAEAGVG